MPVVRLREVKKAGRAVVERRAPEPRNRMIRREAVCDRHATKQQLREMMDEWPGSRNLEPVYESNLGVAETI